MTVLITLTTAGSSTGPFNLYSDLDSFAVPFETNVPKAALVAGYTSTLVPYGTSYIRVVSFGDCNVQTDILIGDNPSTTTTTSTSTTSTSTTSTTTTAAPTTTTTTSTSTSTTSTTSSTTSTTTSTTTTSTTSTSTTTSTTTTVLPCDCHDGTINNNNSFSYYDCNGNLQAGGAESGSTICYDINKPHSTNITDNGPSVLCSCAPL